MKDDLENTEKTDRDVGGDEPEQIGRREALALLKKWSKVVVGSVFLGGVFADKAPAQFWIKAPWNKWGKWVKAPWNKWGKVTPRRWNNKREQRASLARGGWTVVLGKEIDHAEYGRAIGHITASVAAGNPGPFINYLERALEEQIRVLRRRVTGSLRDTIEHEVKRLILDSLRYKRIVVRGRLRLQAGFVAYNHRIYYGDKYTPLPNTFQAYVRYKY